MCGSLATAKERVSGVVVVYGCFPEEDDSILSALSRQPMRTKMQGVFLASSLRKSHDQSRMCVHW